MRNLILIAAAVIMAALTAVPAPADTMVWKIRSKYPYQLHLEFYSQDRNHFWPGGGKVYVLKDSKYHTYRLNCRRNELVCYGAWVSTDEGTYWGVGAKDSRRCRSCCYRCGRRTRSVTLAR